MDKIHVNFEGDIINHADWLSDNGFLSDEEAEEAREYY